MDDVYTHQKCRNEEHWRRNGKLHRDDGPALIYSGGEQIYYKNGFVHREDGPAKINFGEDKVNEWWLGGCYMSSPEQFRMLSKLSDEEITFILLKYGWV